MIHPLPDKPTNDMIQAPSVPSRAQSASSTGAVTISAPAQLRDLKKESTAFVPSSLKRKKTVGAPNTSGKVSTSRINAAPEANLDESKDGEVEAARPDLLGALMTNFPAPTARTGRDEAPTKKPKLVITETMKSKDDYERFIEEIGDIL